MVIPASCRVSILRERNEGEEGKEKAEKIYGYAREEIPQVMPRGVRICFVLNFHKVASLKLIG